MPYGGFKVTVFIEYEGRILQCVGGFILYENVVKNVVEMLKTGGSTKVKFIVESEVEL